MVDVGTWYNSRWWEVQRFTSEESSSLPVDEGWSKRSQETSRQSDQARKFGNWVLSVRQELKNWSPLNWKEEANRPASTCRKSKRPHSSEADLNLNSSTSSILTNDEITIVEVKTKGELPSQKFSQVERRTKNVERSTVRSPCWYYCGGARINVPGGG